MSSLLGGLFGRRGDSNSGHSGSGKDAQAKDTGSHGGRKGSNNSGTSSPARAHLHHHHHHHHTNRHGKQQRTYRYQDFAEKMKDPKAAGLRQSLRTFIQSFSQQKIVFDANGGHTKEVHAFITKIFRSMTQHVLWKGAPREELVNVHESLEKFVMSKLYSSLFEGSVEDRQKDQFINEKIELLLQFVEPEHLDIPQAFIDSETVHLASAEILKMDSFKAPRDKIVCLLNCCKIIMDHLKSLRTPAPSPAPSPSVSRPSTPQLLGDGKPNTNSSKAATTPTSPPVKEIISLQSFDETQSQQQTSPTIGDEDEEGTAKAAREETETGAGAKASRGDKEQEDASDMVITKQLEDEADAEVTNVISSCEGKDTSGETADDASMDIPKSVKVLTRKSNRVNKKSLDRPPSLDDFLPVLIFTIIHAGTQRLHLNIQYISFCRTPARLTGEPWYYFTNLCSAVSFIEQLNEKSLSIDPAEYHRLMEAARASREKELDELKKRDERNNALNANINTDGLRGDGKQTMSDSMSSMFSPVGSGLMGGAATNLSRAELEKQYTFIHVRSADELRVGELERLLREYKLMATRLIDLEMNGITSPFSPKGHDNNDNNNSNNNTTKRQQLDDTGYKAIAYVGESTGQHFADLSSSGMLE